MTTIVGQQHAWGCTIGADGHTTSGSHRRYAHHDMAKIVERAEYVIAAAGNGAACDVVMHTWLPPVPPLAGSIVRFMATDVVPSLRRALTEEGLSMDPEKEDALQVLLATRGEIFHIETDGTVMRHHRGTYGLGSGAGYAIGAIAAGATVSLALQIAADNDTYTGWPFQIVKQAKPGQEIL